MEHASLIPRVAGEDKGQRAASSSSRSNPSSSFLPIRVVSVELVVAEYCRRRVTVVVAHRSIPEPRKDVSGLRLPSLRRIHPRIGAEEPYRRHPRRLPQLRPPSSAALIRCIPTLQAPTSLS